MGMTFASRIWRRITGACENWTLARYDSRQDQYTLTCAGQPDRVVPGEQLNDWVEQDDGTWAEPNA